MASIRFNCSACGQHLEAPPEAAGCAVPCPACGHALSVPSPQPQPQPPSTPSSAPLCAICQTAIQTGEATAECPECHASYHTECWEENNGCAVYGCSKTPEIEQRRAIEIPISYWGQENKPCPSCGREILAAAVRCRYCGAQFSSARPQDTGEFQEMADQAARLPGMKRKVVWLFILSVIPCFAPIAAVWGIAWFASSRRQIRAMPSVFPALFQIGLALAISQCLIIAFVTALYSTVRR